jgi:hypothetical protein
MVFPFNAKEQFTPPPFVPIGAQVREGSSGAELGAPLLDPSGDLPAGDRQSEVHVANGARVGLPTHLEGHPETSAGTLRYMRQTSQGVGLAAAAVRKPPEVQQIRADPICVISTQRAGSASCTAHRP